MIKKILAVLAFFPLSLPAAGQASQQARLDVPYVPTRYPVVDEMLRMAKVEKTDLLYDLGCGDGRIVIGAAQKYGARGVGIDIDPERLKECAENAAKAGVQDKVRFVQGDLFQADFHEATVMTLYLLTSVNLKLRPKLLKELSPGTRLVSHNFGMDEWKPDESSVVKVEDTTHDVFLWIIPANVSGTWRWQMGNPRADWEMTLRQHFQSLLGSVTVNKTPVLLKNAAIAGPAVKFGAEIQSGSDIISLEFEGRTRANAITGTVKIIQGRKNSVWAWNASRDVGTERPIDGGLDTMPDFLE